VAGEHTREALTAWGVADVDGLIATGAAVQATPVQASATPGPATPTRK